MGLEHLTKSCRVILIFYQKMWTCVYAINVSLRAEKTRDDDDIKLFENITDGPDKTVK